MLLLLLLLLLLLVTNSSTTTHTGRGIVPPNRRTDGPTSFIKPLSCVYIYIYIHVCMLVYMYIYIYIYTHMYVVTLYYYVCIMYVYTHYACSFIKPLSVMSTKCDVTECIYYISVCLNRNTTLYNSISYFLFV